MNWTGEKATAATARYNKEFGAALTLDDAAAEACALRGRISRLPPGGVRTPNGGVVWDIDEFRFLADPCPDSVNPSLWRMAQLNCIDGLFEVCRDVWQARGCDYANMTIIRGETGWILVDPLIAEQTAAAALTMVNDTLGERPVSAILVTHSHPDHFGGLRGVTGHDSAAAPPIYVPSGFLKHAASEGVLAGNHMARRAMYQFGLLLPKGAEGLVDGGIGKGLARGSRGFVRPTEVISQTGEERTIDGVRFVFQMASGTEAPSEFTFFLPDHGALCMAEVCTQTLHNLLTPRGASVRDPLLWARTIDEAIVMFSHQADVIMNSHNWPVWGREALTIYLEEQRDIYKYIHDQTLRMANHGMTPDEIAAALPEPDWLSSRMHARGYYGTLKFNVRATYQRYFGFFDGNPTNLDPLPPGKIGQHLVEALGGEEAALSQARKAIERDELQWAATLLRYIVFSREDTTESEKHDAAQVMLSNVLRQMGYRQESSIMRNIYLSGAHELVHGVTPRSMVGGRNEELAAVLPLQDWFDAMAVRLNPDRSRGAQVALAFIVDGTPVAVTVLRQTEHARVGQHSEAPNATLTLTHKQLEALASGNLDLAAVQRQGGNLHGDHAAVQRWLEMHDRFELFFRIVTP